MMDQLLVVLTSTELKLGAIALLMSLAVLGIVMGLYMERQRRQLRGRLNSLVDTNMAGFMDEEVGPGFSERVLRPMARNTLTRMGRMTPSGNLEQIRQKLLAAGSPANLAVIDFLGLKMLFAILIGLGGGLYAFAQPDGGFSNVLLYGAGGALVGLYLPNYWLNRKIRERQAEIRRALPDALDMLTTMVDAGLGFDMALIRLCDKWENPLTHEFSRMVMEMRMGVQRSQALRNLADRVQVPEVSTFAATLIQADHLGISISRILHTQSEQIRLKRRQWVEETAAQMPLKMLPIIVLFIFPALFAIILGPAVPGMLTAFGG
jgi:tight adherence protein C